MQTETKIFLIFGATMLIVFSIGTGGLSFQEAKSKADQNLSALSSEQLSKLVKAKSKFTEVALSHCAKSTGTSPGEFTIVIEIREDGYIRRSWRQGDSKFVLCLQQVMLENFVFRPYSQPFFTSFEHSNAS